MRILAAWTIKRSRITAPVNLTGLPTGRFTATATDGRAVTGRRTPRAEND